MSDGAAGRMEWDDRSECALSTVMHSASLSDYYHLDLYYSFVKQRQSVIYLSLVRRMKNSLLQGKMFLKE